MRALRTLQTPRAHHSRDTSRTFNTPLPTATNAQIFIDAIHARSTQCADAIDPEIQAAFKYAEIVFQLSSLRAFCYFV
jgi:hypothetical protein